MEEWLSDKAFRTSFVMRLLGWGLLLYFFYYGLLYSPLQKTYEHLNGMCSIRYEYGVQRNQYKGLVTLFIESPRWFVTFATQRVRVRITLNGEVNSAEPIRVFLYGEHIIACSAPTTGAHCVGGNSEMRFYLSQEGQTAIGTWYVTAAPSKSESSTSSGVGIEPKIALGEKWLGQLQDQNHNEEDQNHNEALGQECKIGLARSPLEFLRVALALLIDRLLLPPWNNLLLAALAYVIAHNLETRQEERQQAWQKAEQAVALLHEQSMRAMQHEEREEAFRQAVVRSLVGMRGVVKRGMTGAQDSLEQMNRTLEHGLQQVREPLSTIRTEIEFLSEEIRRLGKGLSGKSDLSERR